MQNKIPVGLCCHAYINTLKLRQNGIQFGDDISKFIFLNENCYILIPISMKYVPNGPTDNNPALVWIMAWYGTGNKPLLEPTMV